jgi:hypothetical protein
MDEIVKGKVISPMPLPASRATGTWHESCCRSMCGGSDAPRGCSLGPLSQAMAGEQNWSDAQVAERYRHLEASG